MATLFILDLHREPVEKPLDPLSLSQRLLEQGFEVLLFTEFDEFAKALQQQNDATTTAVVWLDSGDQLQADAALHQQMRELKVGQNQLIPWVVIANQADMAKQITAYQAGVSYYWVQPKDTNELLQRFIQLNDVKKQAYRVVMVDDSEITLEIQTELLRHDGIEV